MSCKLYHNILQAVILQTVISESCKLSYLNLANYHLANYTISKSCKLLSYKLYHNVLQIVILQTIILQIVISFQRWAIEYGLITYRTSVDLKSATSLWAHLDRLSLDDVS